MQGSEKRIRPGNAASGVNFGKTASKGGLLALTVNGSSASNYGACME